MQLVYESIPHWPALAWIAELPTGGEVIRVQHGPRVETRDQWFCESVWAGDFEAGGFDQTDLVFGSGGRLRDGKVTFVSSGSTVDRLISTNQDDRCFVSNSLPCLMRQIQATIDPTNKRYYHLFGSVVCGLERYAREMKTSAGPVRFTYFHNITWDGTKLTDIEKPDTAGHFDSYETYRGFLDDALSNLRGQHVVR